MMRPIVQLRAALVLLAVLSYSLMLASAQVGEVTEDEARHLLASCKRLRKSSFRTRLLFRPSRSTAATT